MTDPTTILVPIRYPLTDASERTLAAASRLAADEGRAELLVLHVDPLQSSARTVASDLQRAVSARVGDADAEVITRRGFFVEEVILEEVRVNDADVVVVGADRAAAWRRLLRRLLRDDPAIGPYLRSETGEGTDVVEVDAAAGASAAEGSDASSA